MKSRLSKRGCDMTSPPLPFVPIPSLPRRMLTIPEAAIYIGATDWFVEEACRTTKLPSRIIGQRRVLDLYDLDQYIDALPFERRVVRQPRRMRIALAA